MKIAMIGAAGLRTPLIVQAAARRQDSLGLSELTLMDIDAKRLELIQALAAAVQAGSSHPLRLSCTTDPAGALDGADFVITTFRVGGIESRVVDERVPLSYGILGQETTGPGGFAMGLRTIPVLMDYVQNLKRYCPNAWLINFANPSGMLAEALSRAAGWERAVGICDGPYSMQGIAAAAVGAAPEELYLDYFGLNHLGWIRSIVYQGQDILPQLIAMLQAAGGIAGLRISPDLIASLGMIPNEYLYYYYYRRQSVQEILSAGETRGEQVARLNRHLFENLCRQKTQADFQGMLNSYRSYLAERRSGYLANPREGSALDSLTEEGAAAGEGYAGVALDLIEALVGEKPGTIILNIPNCGAILGMDDEDVVEVPALVSKDRIQPAAVGAIPTHCLGLMKQVKAYERLAIEAAVEGSYSKALEALTIHPLVGDYDLAKAILDGYIHGHAGLFPTLS